MKLLLTYGKHYPGEDVAYRIGEYLERYNSKDFVVRKHNISVPDRLRHLDWFFYDMPGLILLKLNENPDLHVDLHQGYSKFGVTTKDRYIKLEPSKDLACLMFFTAESFLRGHIKSKGLAFFMKPYDL